MNNKLIWVYVGFAVLILGALVFYMLNSASKIKITAAVNPFATYKQYLK